MPKLVSCANREEKEVLTRYLRSNEYPQGYTKDQKRALRQKADRFVLRGDDIYFKGNECILKAVFEYETDLVDHIIASEHAIAHVGINKMVDLINHKYYGISKTKISDYVRSCEACRNFNSLRTIQPVFINNITHKRDRYIIDCVDLRQYSSSNDGFSWLLNVIDSFSKYIWSIKLKNKTAESVKKGLIYIFNNFGAPSTIQADNGKEFKNNLLKETMLNMHITIIHGRPRHPQSQGQVERVNQTVKRFIAKKLYGTSSNRWIDVHDEAIYGYNTTVHRATSKSPFLLFHGCLGYNRPTSNLILTEDLNGLNNTTNENIINNNDDEISYDAWNINEINDNETEITLITVPDNTGIADNSDSNETIKIEVQKHFQEYKQKIIDNCNSNLAVKVFEVGDHVIIKKDFDMNISTKRKPFESFYEENVYTVVSLLSNNMVELKSNTNGEIRSVYKGTIKKL